MGEINPTDLGNTNGVSVCSPGTIRSHLNTNTMPINSYFPDDDNFGSLKVVFKGPMLKVSVFLKGSFHPATVTSVLALGGNNLPGLAVESKDSDRRTMFYGKKNKTK